MGVVKLEAGVDGVRVDDEPGNDDYKAGCEVKTAGFDSVNFGHHCTTAQFPQLPHNDTLQKHIHTIDQPPLIMPVFKLVLSRGLNVLYSLRHLSTSTFGFLSVYTFEALFPVWVAAFPGSELLVGRCTSRLAG